MLLRQANLEEMLRRAREREEKNSTESITDQEMVDSFFGFLPLLGQEEPVAGGYEVRSPFGPAHFCKPCRARCHMSASVCRT